MRKIYHIQISVQALEGSFSSRALKVILEANTGQDSLSGQIWHPEYHFDESQFAEAYAYMTQQRRLVHEKLQNDQPRPAWQAFGRLTHAAQDFYAHSNYVRLWLSYQSKNGAKGISPEVINPVAEEILNNPKLISGRIYYPWEVLSFIPGMATTMRRFLPEDSHTALNLDSPEQGHLFEYAFVAARKRTTYEFDHLCTTLSPDDLRLFTELITHVDH